MFGIGEKVEELKTELNKHLPKLKETFEAFVKELRETRTAIVDLTKEIKGLRTDLKEKRLPEEPDNKPPTGGNNAA